LISYNEVVTFPTPSAMHNPIHVIANPGDLSRRSLAKTEALAKMDEANLDAREITTPGFASGYAVARDYRFVTESPPSAHSTIRRGAGLPGGGFPSTARGRVCYV